MFWRIQKANLQGSANKTSKKSKETFSLEFCKMEAGIPPDHKVQILHVSTEEIIFKSTARMKEREKTPFIIIYHPFGVKTPSNVVEILFYVEINEKAQISDSHALYKAYYLDTNEDEIKQFFQYLKHIETTQLDKLVDYHERRISYRLNRMLPVYSKNIKGYKALTKNISCTGAMITCEGGVKKNDIISLQLEFDDANQAPIHLKGEVCWIEDSTPQQMRVGIRFIDLDKYEQKILERYIEDVRKMLERF